MLIYVCTLRYLKSLQILTSLLPSTKPTQQDGIGLFPAILICLDEELSFEF